MRKRAPAPAPTGSARRRWRSDRKWSENSDRFATSLRYAKTSSRGLPIVADTVTGSMPAQRVRGSGGAQPDRVAELGPVHRLRRRRLGALAATAQRAQHAATLVEVDALPHQRRPAALAAPAAPRDQPPDAAAQQPPLQLRSVGEEALAHAVQFLLSGQRSCMDGWSNDRPTRFYGE